MIAKSDSESASGGDLVDQIANEMRSLPASKLNVIRELVAFFAAKPDIELDWESDISDAEILKAVRPVLDECWDDPEEDAAWAHL